MKREREREKVGGDRGERRRQRERTGKSIIRPKGQYGIFQGKQLCPFSFVALDNKGSAHNI